MLRTPNRPARGSILRHDGAGWGVADLIASLRRTLTIIGHFTSPRTWTIPDRSDTFAGTSDLEWDEKTANFTAEYHRTYLATATLTVTDPTPVAGQGYSVIVINGTCTIGGTGYAPGVQVFSVYHSGAWVRTVLPSLVRANSWTGSQTVTGTVAASAQVIGGATSASLSNSLFCKQTVDGFSGAISMQRNATLDTWAFGCAPDNGWYLGYASNASGANAEGDFTAALSVSSTGILTVIGAATSAPSAGQVRIGGGELRTYGVAYVGSGVGANALAMQAGAADIGFSAYYPDDARPGGTPTYRLMSHWGLGGTFGNSYASKLRLYGRQDSASAGTDNATYKLVTSNQSDSYVSEATLWEVNSAEFKLYGNLVLPKTSGNGVKVDTTTPTFPWRDLEGVLTFDPAGASSPNHTVYRTGVNQWAFAASDQADVTFHMPHDWAPGTDVYIHVHWSHNGTAITGNAVFTFSYTYAKGHNQANFPATKSQTITYATTDIATTPQYRHRIDELQLSDATGSGNYLNRGDFEPDGLILLNCTLTTLPTITGGDLFIHHIDIHYQSTNIGTKAKAPSFYT